MLNLFTNPLYPNLDAFNKFPQWGYVEKNILENIDRVVSYLRFTETQVSNSNILVRFLLTITDNLRQDDDSYYRSIFNVLKNKANILGIGVGNNYPKVMRDNLYNNSYEIYIGKVDPYVWINNKVHEKKNPMSWLDLIAMEPIYHSYNVLDYEIREYKRDMNRSYSIYGIDLITLAMQYKKWHNLRVKAGRDTRPHIFVSQVVIPNMLKKDINLVIINRVMSRLDGLKNLRPTRKYVSLVLKDVEPIVNKILDECIDVIDKRALYYDRVLKTIPCVGDTNMLDVLQVKYDLDSIQMSWVLWLARIPIIKELLILGGVRDLSENKEYVTKLNTYLGHYNTGNVKIPYRDLPDSVSDSFKSDLYFIRSIALG